MKKKHPEHVNLERWLVSYADFITLLFAFFVVMYAISQADMAKFRKVTESIRSAFSAAGSTGMVDLTGTAGGNTAKPFDNIEAPGGRAQNLPLGKFNTASEPDPDILEVKELLEETISLEMGVADVSERITMRYDPRGLVIRIAAKDFFDAGKAEVPPDLRPVLDRIGRILVNTGRRVRIEGHTDMLEDEGHAEGHADGVSESVHGWTLSTARAVWVAEYWKNRLNMNPKNIEVAGRSHYKPLSESKDKWGSAKNRRIEIIILNQRE